MHVLCKLLSIYYYGHLFMSIQKAMTALCNNCMVSNLPTQVLSGHLGYFQFVCYYK